MATPKAQRARDTRHTMPAGRVLVVMLVCISVWAVLAAPTLYRSAQASNDGARRSAAIAALTPFKVLSNVTQLTKVTDAVMRAFGHDPNDAVGGQLSLEPEPLPTVTGEPSPTVEPTVDSTDPMRDPTGGDKLRVAVAGDSLASGLGYGAERVFRPALVRVTRQGRISTGLARPDYFNWPGAMRQIVAGFHPDLVMVMLGENDAQGLRAPNGAEETPTGTVQWHGAYLARVENLMRIAVSGGARVVWVGLPAVKDEARWDFIRRQNDIFEEAADEVPNVAYLDSWELFAAPDGGYSAYYRRNGFIQQVRESDGLHFNGAGYEILARAAALTAEKEFGLSPRTLNT
jgi:hypothetical protein